MWRRSGSGIVIKPFPAVAILLVLAAFTFSVNPVYGSDRRKPGDVISRRLDSEEALEDLEHLYEQLQTVHMDLYFSRDKAAAEASYGQLREKVEEKRTRTLRELYTSLAPFVAGFNDAHTSLTFYDEFTEYTDLGGGIIPFYVYLREDSIILTETVAETEVPLGSTVLSVNGLSAEKILEDVLNLISYERKAWGLAMGSRLFPIYVLSLYGPRETFEVTYRTPDGVKEEVLLPAVPLEEYNEKKSQLYPRYEGDWSLEFVAEDVALLTINTFAGSKKKEFRDFLEKSFREIQANMTGNLIIDLRKNGGGSTNVSDLLYSYVSWKPYRNFARVEVKYSDPVLMGGGGGLNPFSRAWEFLRTRFTGDNVVVYENDYKKPPEREYRFDGDLYLLVGRSTFSTAVDFAAVIKDLEAGTIVGQETGGLATCFGDTYRAELPNSGLSLRISYKHFVRTGGFDDGRGVLPDVEVSHDPIAVLNGTDRVLNLAISLAVGGTT